jgi:hypothetical protein
VFIRRKALVSLKHLKIIRRSITHKDNITMEKNGLWKNIREKAKENKMTGAKPKKPTAAMLKQEMKIKASKKK